MSQLRWTHIVFTTALLCLQAEALSAPGSGIKQVSTTSIWDTFGYINTEELIPLQQKLDMFEVNHKLPVYVVVSEKFPVGIHTHGLKLASSHFNINENSDYLIFLVEIKRKTSVIHFKSRHLTAKRGLIEQLNHQFILTNLGAHNTVSLGQAVTYAIEAIDQLIKDNNGIKAVKSPLSSEAYSKKFVKVMYFFCAVIILFMGIWLHKSLRGGKRYENTLFYPLNRAHPITKWTLFFSLLLIIGYWLYEYIFYYDELFTSYFTLLLAIVPISIPLIHIGHISQDYLTVRKTGGSDNKDNALDVVPACLLLNPKISPSELLEKTFFSLVIRGQILVEQEWRTWRDGRQKNYTRIGPGPNFALSQATPYEWPLLEPLKNMPDGYSYYFKNFLVSVNSNIHGLKHFEKDLVSLPLLKFGLIQKFHWVLNKYVPTDVGIRQTRELKKVAQSCQKEFSEWHRQGDLGLDFIKSINTKVLLLSDFKSAISGLKERINREFVQEVGQSPLPHLFDLDFDIYEFEEAYDDVKTPRKLTGWEGGTIDA